jgi:hypothetical protein
MPAQALGVAGDALGQVAVGEGFVVGDNRDAVPSCRGGAGLEETIRGVHKPLPVRRSATHVIADRQPAFLQLLFGQRLDLSG